MKLRAPALLIWLLGVVIVILFLVAMRQAVRSHGAAQWIQQGGYKNAIGELCCGEKDCAVFLRGTITAVAGGYAVDAVFRLTVSGIDTDYAVKEFVPYAEATPSPDGQFYRCFWGGQRKCFFAPPPNT